MEAYDRALPTKDVSHFDAKGGVRSLTTEGNVLLSSIIIALLHSVQVRLEGKLERVTLLIKSMKFMTLERVIEKKPWMPSRNLVKQLVWVLLW